MSLTKTNETPDLRDGGRESLSGSCPECNGTGYDHFNEEGDPITQSEYNELEKHERSRTQFDACEGTGEINQDNDYEPEYEHDN